MPVQVADSKFTAVLLAVWYEEANMGTMNVPLLIDFLGCTEWGICDSGIDELCGTRMV